MSDWAKLRLSRGGGPWPTAFFGLLVALALVCWTCPGASQEPPKQKTLHSFRPPLKHAADDPKGLERTGPAAEQCVTFEPGGIRITLPVDFSGQTGFHGERLDTGVVVPVEVRGDFEITATYEVLREPEPTNAGKLQTRLTLDAGVDRRAHIVTTVSRRVAKWGTQYSAWVRREQEQKNKEIAARGATGRLRLVREGVVMSYFVSEEADGPFKLIEQYPFSAAPLEDVRVTASTGGPKAALDVRITDLVIRGEGLSQTTDGVPALAPPRNVWIVVAAALLTLSALTAAFIVRRRRVRPVGTKVS
jgi:hypothetical protein